MNRAGTILKLLVIAIVTTALAPGAASAGELPNQRTDMRVLILTAHGDEPSAEMWEDALGREGVPFDEWRLAGDRDWQVTPDMFADTLPDGTPYARYQGVVVATGGLVYERDGAYVSAMSDVEWQVLNNFEATYGIRQVTASIYPSAAYGLNTPTYAGPGAGYAMTPTTAGKGVFPELASNVKIDEGSWSYFTTPLSVFQPGESYTSLLNIPDGRTVMGVFKHADSREELVFTVDSNQNQLHSMVLGHGLVNWITKRHYLGTYRNYLAMEVDDLFLPNEVWDPTTNTTGNQTVRMSWSDVSNANSWVRNRGQRLDFAFNGGGNLDAGGRLDSLLTAVKLYRSRFGFVNHTLDHIDFDDVDDDPSNGLQPATRAEMNSQIKGNVDWARANGISIASNELVTGEHSGIHTNPEYANSMTDNAIAWTGDDNSRYPRQGEVGSAKTVPRYPTNVYYNTSTRTQQIDEYNYLYLPPELGGGCVNTETTTCRSTPITWDEYVATEGTAILRHMLMGDPRPHYAHQSNLTGDRIVLSVLDNAITRYKALLKTTWTQPNLTTSGDEIARLDIWNDSSDQFDSYVQNGKINITSYALLPTSVPISGSTSVGSADNVGRRTGWKSINPGTTIQLNAVP